MLVFDTSHRGLNGKRRKGEKTKKTAYQTAGPADDFPVVSILSMQVAELVQPTPCADLFVQTELIPRMFHPFGGM